MIVLRDALQKAKKFLKDAHIESFRKDADDLFSKALNLSRLDLYLDYNRPLEDKELTLLRTWLARRAKGEPMVYIFEEVSFCQLELNVNPDVLIPRPETEELVEKILKTLPPTPLTLWDICTGSGCIGLAIKKARPDIRVILSDLSPSACKTALENAKKNGLDVDIFQGDLFNPFQGKKADLIVSNPPYISLQEYKDLDPQVQKFEPKQALYGGETGLDYYKKFNEEALQFLNPQGKLWLELGAFQGKALLELFNCPPWKSKELLQDSFGKDRFLVVS